MAFRLNPELKNAWDDVLFWAERLSHKQADNHPEWRVEFEKAKAHLTDVKARLKANKPDQ